MFYIVFYIVIFIIIGATILLGLYFLFDKTPDTQPGDTYQAFQLLNIGKKDMVKSKAAATSMEPAESDVPNNPGKIDSPKLHATRQKNSQPLRQTSHRSTHKKIKSTQQNSRTQLIQYREQRRKDKQAELSASQETTAPENSQAEPLITDTTAEQNPSPADRQLIFSNIEWEKNRQEKSAQNLAEPKNTALAQTEPVVSQDAVTSQDANEAVVANRQLERVGKITKEQVAEMAKLAAESQSEKIEKPAIESNADEVNNQQEEAQASKQVISLVNEISPQRPKKDTGTFYRKNPKGSAELQEAVLTPLSRDTDRFDSHLKKFVEIPVETIVGANQTGAVGYSAQPTDETGQFINFHPSYQSILGDTTSQIGHLETICSELDQIIKKFHNRPGQEDILGVGNISTEPSLSQKLRDKIDKSVAAGTLQNLDTIVEDLHIPYPDEIKKQLPQEKGFAGYHAPDGPVKFNPQPNPNHSQAIEQWKKMLGFQ